MSMTENSQPHSKAFANQDFFYGLKAAAPDLLSGHLFLAHL